MQTTDNVKTRATKLHEILGSMGHELDQSQCLDVVSDIEKQPDYKSLTPPISESRSTAEQYMNTIVEGYMEQDYEKAIRYTEEKYLVHFTKKGFNRDVLNSYEDLGGYVRREFLGYLKAEIHPEKVHDFPDHVRYVWRGIFEKNEGLMIMGLYLKNGTYYTSDFSCK